MTSQELKDILHNGLWKQNTGVVQILGMCPLLAISNTVVNAVSLGLATTLVMVLSGASISPIRNYVLIISVLVTVVQYLMNAYMYSLYIVLGIFIPLIVTNCIVLARAEAFASKNATLPSAVDGFAMGLGLTAVLFILGGMREILGHGTLFAGFDLALGDIAKHWVITIIPNYHGFLLAILPPGAFICLGLLIAGRNYLVLRADQKLQSKKIRAQASFDGTEPAAS